MSVKKIEKFKTTDDNLFDCQKEAEKHQKYLDEQDKIKDYIFHVTVTQKFRAGYDVETDQGLEAARDLAYTKMLEMGQVIQREYSWEPEGSLEVLSVVEEDEL